MKQHQSPLILLIYPDNEWGHFCRCLYIYVKKQISLFISCFFSVSECPCIKTENWFIAFSPCKKGRIEKKKCWRSCVIMKSSQCYGYERHNEQHYSKHFTSLIWYLIYTYTYFYQSYFFIFYWPILFYLPASTSHEKRTATFVLFLLQNAVF